MTECVQGQPGVGKPGAGRRAQAHPPISGRTRPEADSAKGVLSPLGDRLWFGLQSQGPREEGTAVLLPCFHQASTEAHSEPGSVLGPGDTGMSTVGAVPGEGRQSANATQSIGVAKGATGLLSF